MKLVCQAIFTALNDAESITTFVTHLMRARHNLLGGVKPPRPCGSSFNLPKNRQEI